MGKIKLPGQNLSLRKSLVLYAAVSVLLVLGLLALTFSICEQTKDRIRDSYPFSGERYYLTNEQGERLGEGVSIGNVPVLLSEQDERKIALLELLCAAAAPVYSVLGILAAAFLFYRNKLRRPLLELRRASEKIGDNDLDFSLAYDSRDELGELTASFERMRSTLADNFSEMWRQVEERKALNAAFAHELRTPLTVLKGYNEMLKAGSDEETREIAAAMGKHLSRMEAYVSSMSRLRRLEDTKPEYKNILLEPFLASLKESAKILCVQKGKNLCPLDREMPYPQEELHASELLIDPEFVSQVCYNLIANAVRYAETSVTLSFTVKENGLLLTVSDDGKGFHPNSLSKGANPYFTEETDHSEHFGLGLYTCRLLCSHHGGYLKLENGERGAKVSAFFKAPTL